MSADDFLSGGFLRVGAKRRKGQAAARPADQPGADQAAGEGPGRTSEAAEHRAQLEALKDADPEFYAYLQQTDADLLRFEEVEDEEEQDDGPATKQESDDDTGADLGNADARSPIPARQAAKASTSGLGNVTSDLIKQWCQDALHKKSLRATRNLLKAYRVACHYGETEEELDVTMRIASASTFNDLLLFVLKEIHTVFCALLGIMDSTELTVHALRKAPRWRKLDPLIKSYLGNTLHLLLQVTDEAMLAFLLRRVRESAVFLVSSERLQRRLLRAALGVFGEGSASPRLQALLLLRALALHLPQPMPSNVLKGAYRAFAQNAKFMTAGNAAHVAFMGSGLVELYGLDPAASYEHAFHALKQLAQLMRSALVAKSKESFRQVYCWQTLNCLDLWARLLGAHASKQELAALVYPCAQLLQGAARLLPSPRYFPLHLRCLRALARLERAAGAYVPLAAPLLDMLDWSGLSKALSSSAPGRPSESSQLLRVSKATLGSAAFQHDLVDQVMELLAEHLASWASSAAFPELAHTTSLRLRAFAKRTRVERFSSAARGLIAAIAANTCHVGTIRDAAGFAPKDAASVLAFATQLNAAKQAPLAQYAETLGEQARQRRTLRLAENMAAGRRSRSGKKEDAENAPSDEDDMEGPSTELLLPQPHSRQPAQQRPAKKLASYPEDLDGDASHEEDVVTAYRLSDEDE